MLSTIATPKSGPGRPRRQRPPFQVRHQPGWARLVAQVKVARKGGRARPVPRALCHSPCILVLVLMLVLVRVRFLTGTERWKRECRRKKDVSYES
jgi:hypothetical protein